MPQDYNDLLDSDQFHESEITVTGRSQPIPAQVNDRGIPFGGNPSTALNAVNFVTVNKSATAARNLGYIRDNIRRRKEYEKMQAEKS